MGDPDSPSAPKKFRGFGLDALVTGLSLALSMVFAMLWWQARQEVGSLHDRMEPLRDEVARYRSGLREEVLRTQKLSEDLKAAQNKTASAR